MAERLLGGLRRDPMHTAHRDQTGTSCINASAGPCTCRMPGLACASRPLEGTVMAKGDIETYHEGGVWKNRVQGGERASNTAETKAQAQATGRQMAKDRGVEHVVKKLDGTIGERNTYPRSRDKNPPPG